MSKKAGSQTKKKKNARRKARDNEEGKENIRS
jgi:hypothetical protein